MSTDPKDWTTRGKTIAQLIEELESFEDPTLEVRISLDSGMSHEPISLVTHQDGACMLTFVPASH